MTDYEKGQRDIINYIRSQTMLIVNRQSSSQDTLLDLINLLKDLRPLNPPKD